MGACSAVARASLTVLAALLLAAGLVVGVAAAPAGAAPSAPAQTAPTYPWTPIDAGKLEGTVLRYAGSTTVPRTQGPFISSSFNSFRWDSRGWTFEGWFKIPEGSTCWDKVCHVLTFDGTPEWRDHCGHMPNNECYPDAHQSMGFARHFNGIEDYARGAVHGSYSENPAHVWGGSTGALGAWKRHGETAPAKMSDWALVTWTTAGTANPKLYVNGVEMSPGTFAQIQPAGKVWHQVCFFAVRDCTPNDTTWGQGWHDAFAADVRLSYGGLDQQSMEARRNALAAGEGPGEDTPPEPMEHPGTSCVSEGGLSMAQVWQVIREAGFPESSHQVAISVVFAESGGKVDAYNGANTNGSADHGLFQINSIHSQYDRQRLLSDALYNARAAFHISSGGTNWQPWVAYTNGSYQQFMQAALATINGGAPNGTIPCKGSTGGADFDGGWDGDGPPAGDDGGTDCGFSLNMFRVMRCVLEWAFVPKAKSYDFSHETSQLRDSSAGQAATGIVAGGAQLVDFVQQPAGCFGGVAEVYGETLHLCEGVAHAGLPGHDSPPHSGNLAAKSISALITIALWVAVAVRVIRTMPWTKGRDGAEPGA